MKMEEKLILNDSIPTQIFNRSGNEEFGFVFEIDRVGWIDWIFISLINLLIWQFIYLRISSGSKIV